MIDVDEMIRVRGNPRPAQRAHAVIRSYLQMVQRT
jgi:hypothetical protein